MLTVQAWEWCQLSYLRGISFYIFQNVKLFILTPRFPLHFWLFIKFSRICCIVGLPDCFEDEEILYFLRFQVCILSYVVPGLFFPFLFENDRSDRKTSSLWNSDMVPQVAQPVVKSKLWWVILHFETKTIIGNRSQVEVQMRLCQSVSSDKVAAVQPALDAPAATSLTRF